jgi:small subunit ribosomal protein S7
MLKPSLLTNKISQTARIRFRRISGIRKIVNFVLSQRVERFNVATMKTNVETIRKDLIQNVFSLFSHRLLKNGKKQFAETVFNKVIAGLRGRGYDKPLQFIADILLYLKPVASVYSKKKGRKTITIPYLLNLKTEVPIAVRWIIQSARNRTEKGIVNQLLAELLDVNERKGASVTRKLELEKLVSQNLSSLRTLKIRYRRKRKFSLARFGSTR